jgi:hypothetical protein
MTALAYEADAVEAAFAAARTAEAAYAVFHDLAARTVGAKLFTVMLVDMDAMVARRAYSSDPVAYPTSGTKPIEPNAWLDTMATRRVPFVANTLDDIAAVFPDAELIGRLGCGSVVNLPVFEGGAFVATMNMLDVAGHYDAARVAFCREHLSAPARRAVGIARAAN